MIPSWRISSPMSSQIGSQESAPGTSTGTPNTGTGLAAEYFNNMTLTGAPALERVERVNFTWSASPGPGVNANQFSVRWTGFVEALPTEPSSSGRAPTTVCVCGSTVIS